MRPQVSTVKETLSGSTVHQLWENTYRNAESERFYERVFDWIADHELLGEKRALDIGCGIGQHSIRLAKRGCDVVAADFSDGRVEAARANIEQHGFASQISVRNEDLESGLSFSDASFDVVLCWGVLMHIPRLEAAVAELVRIARSGGTIVLYEANLFGVDAMATRLASVAKTAMGRGSVRRVRDGGFGREYWTQTSAGELFIRHCRIRALVLLLEQNGCRLKHRIAGEFTEKYSLGGALGRLCHSWNNIWFAAGHIPYLAHGNLLIFECRRTAPASLPD